MSTYDASSIEVLEGLEPVRRRPGMYIGDVNDGSGLHHMLWEVLGNAIDEHLAGHASEIKVQLRRGEVVVEDNGRGISVEPTHGRVSWLERVATTLHGAPTADGHTPHVHVGPSLYGSGIACVNGLSDEFEIESHREGKRYRLRCRRGRQEGELACLGATRRRGTQVRFTPDPTIFNTRDFDRDQVRTRMWELACLSPALTLRLEFEDEAGETLRAPGGLVDWVQASTKERAPRPVPPHAIGVRGAYDDVRVEVALQWAGTGRPQITGFVRHAPASEGTHVEGFWQGLTDAWATAQHQDEAAPHALREVLGQGLVAAVHVELLEPRFGAPTRDLLTNREAERAVRVVTRQALEPLLGVGTPLGKALSARFFFTFG